MSRLPAIGLELSFAEMERELTNMRLVARRFLEPNSFERVLPRLIDELKNTKASSSTHSWQIHSYDPIRTVPSNGEYESSGKGNTVSGELTMIWEIRPIQEVGARKSVPKRSFRLVGKASVRVRILKCADSGDSVELARWRFEIADKASPGSYFHVQVLGDDEDTLFPKSLPVPRLPSILLTPMDALEFLLAELFQTSWKAHVASENDYVRDWATCQRRRLLRVLDWKRAKIKDASGSPWTSLKGAQPRFDMLLS